MTKWLASVQSVDEVMLLLPHSLPDILDMKDPARGALGALAVDEVKRIVDLVDKRCLSSATIGDLPMEAKTISPLLFDMATTGVDYIKIGLFPDPKLSSCLSDLATTLKALNTPVIAVLFADKPLDRDYLALLKRSGFYGVMVDTAIKNGQSLLDHWDQKKLVDFVHCVHGHQLLCGLAGALRLQDITTLSPLGADYLGFRSALCEQRQRTAVLNLQAIQSIERAIKAPSAAKQAV